jgi:hypothetical protein
VFRRKGEIGRYVFLLAILIFWLAVLYVFTKAPSTTDDVPRKALPSAQVTAQPGSKVLTGQTPRPERTPHKPISQGINIYVVDTGISPVWGLNKAITGWKKARWTDIILVKSCPVARPCITVSEKDLTKTEAGRTNFGYRVEDITIYLNASLIWDPFKAQSTLAHEMGHTLGAPHITGTSKTLMTAKDGFYRTMPTDLDIKAVDDLGPWQLEKMYEASGKTLDVRQAPK